MHVRDNPRLIWLTIGMGGIDSLSVPLIMTFSDYVSRGWIPFPGK